MLLKTVLLLITISAASAVRVNIRACPGGHRMPEWFESNDCTADRCTLRRNQVFSGRASVIPQTAFTQLNVGVDASLFGLAFRNLQKKDSLSSIFIILYLSNQCSNAHP